MILYQLAKKLEERNRLTESIQQSAGDIAELMDQKGAVDSELLKQANDWMAPELAMMQQMGEISWTDPHMQV